jgi:hypothetical protein
MTHQVAIFTGASHAITFNTKKGIASISAEGALFKGGAALAALKDAALDAALGKAHDGKYRAAADIIGAAFPSTAKAFDKIMGIAWANKSSMKSYLAAIERAEEPTKGFSKKQENALILVRTLRNTVTALAADVEAAEIKFPEIIEA